MSNEQLRKVPYPLSRGAGKCWEKQIVPFQMAQMPKDFLQFIENNVKAMHPI